MNDRLLVGDTKIQNLDEGSMKSLFSAENVKRFQEIMMMYRCAIKEVQTKLENLNDELSTKRQRNPYFQKPSPIEKLFESAVRGDCGAIRY